ncbi:MAG: class I SAM-dependent methyltransferase [Candidatus Magasanikbacteria bacterium]|nr:class I SAM-dependent methyltransferase [Candidatus Magasanikbacteria bacterium]
MRKRQWTKSVADQWGLFLPPARPSLSELAKIEEIILAYRQKKPNARAAILGSTPEYRDLCSTLNISYTCIDFSRANFEILGQYLLHKDSAANLVVSDWRKMNFKDKFDIFIGDLFTCVTPVADHALVYKNVKKHLVPGGLLINKAPLRTSNRAFTHKQIFTKYRQTPQLRARSPFAAVWHEVLLADYDFKTDSMNCETSKQKLQASFRRGIITEYEFTEFKKRWDALGDFNMNIPLRHEYLKSLKKYFKIKQITSGGDWYQKICPIIIAENS